MEIEFDEENNEDDEAVEDEKEKMDNKRKFVFSIALSKPKIHEYLTRPFNEILLYFDNILAAKGSNIKFNNSDIEYILTYHPDYENKELIYLSELVVKRYPNSNLKKTRLYTILINNEDGVVDDGDYVSLNRCIRNALKPTNEQNIRENHVGIAFYNTIRGYPIGFSMVSCDFCIKCSKLRNVKLYCGEQYRFSELLHKFLIDMKLTLFKIDINILRSGIILKDIRLADRWSTFYIKQCDKVQYICYACYQVQVDTKQHSLDKILMANEKSLATHSQEEGEEDDDDEDDYMITSPHTAVKCDITHETISK